jgi:acyl-CoA thioester hydrolase
MTEDFNFFAPVKVRYNETDLQGHVNFGHYLFYFDVGLTEYFEKLGYGYQDMLEDGVDILYVESHCKYLSPAHFPEVLNVYTRVAHLGRRSIRFEFKVVAAHDSREVVTGHIVAVSATSGDFQPIEIPDRFRAAVESFEGRTL